MATRGFYSRDQIAQIAEKVLGELLPGRSVQNPYVQSLLQNYKIGSRLQTPDGLVWHYAHADATGVTATYRRRAVVSTVVAQNFKSIGISPIGSYTVVINDTNVAHVADYWANGMASMFPTAPDYSNDNPRMIKSSTASNGTSVTLTLYFPLAYAMPNNQDLYCCPCVYSSIREAVSATAKGANSVVGYTWMAVTASYYCWVQTWGHCQPVHTGIGMGITAGDRDVYINYNDGTVISNGVATFASNQRIGYIIPVTTLAPGGDEEQVMLQLDP